LIYILIATDYFAIYVFYKYSQVDLGPTLIILHCSILD